LPLTTLSQETRWAYSTLPPSPHCRSSLKFYIAIKTKHGSLLEKASYIGCKVQMLQYRTLLQTLPVNSSKVSKSTLQVTVCIRWHFDVDGSKAEAGVETGKRKRHQPQPHPILSGCHHHRPSSLTAHNAVDKGCLMRVVGTLAKLPNTPHRASILLEPPLFMPEHVRPIRRPPSQLPIP